MLLLICSSSLIPKLADIPLLIVLHNRQLRYLKDGGSEVADIYVVFTKILCGRNFCVWYITKLKFTVQLQIASLSLYPQFETNLMSTRKVIKLLLRLKSAKAHGKSYIKVKLHLVHHLLRNCLLKIGQKVRRLFKRIKSSFS